MTVGGGRQRLFTCGGYYCSGGQGLFCVDIPDMVEVSGVLELRDMSLPSNLLLSTEIINICMIKYI